jgi:hypothetical protein
MTRGGVWSMRLALLAITVLVYFPLWKNQFVDYDDEQLITYNPYVTGGLSWEGFCWAWTHHEGPYWMPVTWITFQVDALATPHAEPRNANLSTLCPLMFHAQNLFWHACNVQLLFALLLRLTQLPWRCFVVSALFAVHPMQVESVAWAIERKDMLMCLFGLLSLWAYARYVESRSPLLYLAMLLAYQCSLMCKPMLLTFPCVLLLFDFWPLRRWTPWAGSRKTLQPTPRSATLGRLLLEKVPVLAVATIMAIVTLATRVGESMPDLTLVDRVMNALSGYRWYIVTTFYPVDLCIFYPHPVHDWKWLPSLVGLALVLVGSLASLLLAARYRWLPMGWFWFLGTLVPVIGLTQGGHQAWADRFCYWPHIGLFIAIVWGFAEVAAALRLPALLAAGAWGAVLATFMVLTWIQIGYWRDSVSVWEHAVAVTENNDKACEHLAVAYRRVGRLDEARSQIDEALRIQRDRRLRFLQRAR